MPSYIEILEELTSKLSEDFFSLVVGRFSFAETEIGIDHLLNALAVKDAQLFLAMNKP